MKRKTILVLVSISIVLMVSLISPVAGTTVDDFIGVDVGDKFEYRYTLNNGTVHEDFEFTMEILTVDDPLGNGLGADITWNYTSSNASAQSILNGFYTGPLTIKESVISSFLPDPNDQTDQYAFKASATAIVSLNYLMMVINKNRPLEYQLDLVEDGGPCNITLNFHPFGIIDDFIIVDEDYGGTLDFSLIREKFDDDIPGFPIAIIGLVSLVTLGFLIKKYKTIQKN